MTERDLTERRSSMKSLLIIRNGRGIVAEGDDMQELQAAYAKVVDGHRNQQPDVHVPKVQQSLPAFESIRECHHESETGVLCILKTEDMPHAAGDYYQAGFVS